MSRRLRKVLWILPVVVLGFTSLAYSHFDPRGWGSRSRMFKWWERPEVVQRLKLTDQQINQIREIYSGETKKSIDLKAEFEKQHLELEQLLQQDPLDEDKIAKQIDNVQAARAALAKNQLLMRVKIAKVLSSDQRKQLDTIRKEMREQAMRRYSERGPRRSEGPRPPEEPHP
ncbi:MAG TPA: Spy/CpxP family protein refolding chaperone [Candidatus Limnocylindrales bacterium]|nr:Spy/CpxP family protein refolding chaperone [Candidatus Limnocylindrales bacterium]